MNDRELIDVYDEIYKAGRPFHPVRGRLDPYGAQETRDWQFTDFIKRRLEPGATVLDASCGRGHLARALVKSGYTVTATEVSAWLIENELKDLEAELCAYSAIREHFAGRQFDAVCSNDVLEHLENADKAAEAISQLCEISRRFVLISVGLGRGAVKYPQAIGSRLKDLHTCTPGHKWWRRTIEKSVRPLHFYQTHKTLFLFGEKIA